ncbi:trypsin-like serine protease [Vibrio sp.]|nr:trypsin-like serine protease [Vibrio sp.]
MKKFNALFSVVTVTTPIFISHSALAIAHGEDVSPNDYQDFIVRIEVSDVNGHDITCGATLIGGDYILTAGHCVGTSDRAGPNSTRQYQWDIDYGADNTIKVFQGIQNNDNPRMVETTYEIVSIFDNTYWPGEEGFELIKESIIEEFGVVRAQYPDALSINRIDNSLTEEEYRQEYDQDFTDEATRFGQRDVALLKLSTPVSQETHAALSSGYDVDAQEVIADQNFTFRGWGNGSSGSRPEVMQEMTFNVQPIGWDIFNTFFGRAMSYSTDNNECEMWCTFHYEDTFKLKSDVFYTVGLSGDSGSPLVQGNTVMGIINSTDYSSINTFTRFSQYMGLFGTHIDQVVAPKQLYISHEEKANATKRFDIKVQNLSLREQSISPESLVDYVTVSGCEDVMLPPEAACDLVVDVDINHAPFSNGNDIINEIIALNDADNQMMSIHASEEKLVSQEEDYYYTDEWDNNDEGSAGGSMGWWSIVGLFVLMRLKRRQ